MVQFKKTLVAPRKGSSTDPDGDPAYNGTSVLQVIDSTNFVVNTGINTNPHLYNRGGVVRRPLKVIIDDPLPYAGIALTYSSDSVSGVGTGGFVDVVVGQGSSIISFRITNTGSGYGNDEILTLPIGGPTGIPTDPTKTYKEFQLTLDPCFYDEFTGWSMGEFETVDNVEKYIDGTRVTFPLSVEGDLVSILSSKGSKINIEDVLIVFVNDILQKPGSGYTFPGGSNITFTEPLKKGDTVKISFYKGGSNDVILKEILETVSHKNKNVITDGRVSEPKALFMGFGDSALEFELRVRIFDIKKRYDVVSELNFKIDEEFQKNKIIIPFPQRDIHIKDWSPESKEKSK